MKKFIAFDWCGWNERYGRFTFVDNTRSTIELIVGYTPDTIVQQAYMNQTQWDQAQLEWFRKYPGLTVYRCPGRYFPDPDNVMGTVNEIIERLEKRV